MFVLKTAHLGSKIDSYMPAPAEGGAGVMRVPTAVPEHLNIYSEYLFPTSKQKKRKGHKLFVGRSLTKSMSSVALQRLTAKKKKTAHSS